MAAGRIVLPPYMPTRNRDGLLVDQARLTVYENETTVKATIYSDDGLTTPQANPVIANSSGQFPPIWAEAGTTESPVLYSLAIADASGASVGNPGVFDNWQPSVNGETAASVLAEAAADSAAASAIDAAASATVAEDALDEILAAAAAAPETLPLLNKANLNGGNVASTGNAADFRQNIGAVAKTANLSDLTDATAARINIGSEAYAASTTAATGQLFGSALYVRTAGFAAAGDLGAALYKRVGSEPSHAGKFQSADGTWWELAEAEVRPEMFGLFTNATVTTATLKNALDYAFATSKTLICGGSHTINGPITTENVSSGNLNLNLDRDWTITVDAAATAFNNVIAFASSAVANFCITGARLTIDGNAKAGAGLYFRHDAASDGGTVDIQSPVKVVDMSGSASTPNSAGIFILGRFQRVTICQPEVTDITRLNASGFTSGISVQQFVGLVEIYGPVVKRISSGAGTVDADGIKCFGRQATTDPARRQGQVRIYSPIMDDCQGRSYKDQCGDTVLYSPVVRRDAAVMVANAQCIEFDFQFGGGLVLNALCEYKKNGSTSPFHAGQTESVAAFQQFVNDVEMTGSIQNTTIVSDVQINRFVLHRTAAGAKASVTNVDGLTATPSDGLATSMFVRAIVEFDVAEVLAKTEQTTINVRNISGPFTCPVLGNTGYTTGDLTGKLNWLVDHCSTTLAVTGNSTRALNAISGNQISAFRSFMLGENPGFRNFYTGWTFDVRNLRAGTKLVIDLGTSTVTNNPAWGSSGNGYIECKGLGFFSTTSQDTICMAYLDNATATPSAWFTQDGGANWGQIK